MTSYFSMTSYATQIVHISLFFILIIKILETEQWRHYYVRWRQFLRFLPVFTKVASTNLKIEALPVIRSTLNFQRMFVSKLNSNWKVIAAGRYLLPYFGSIKKTDREQIYPPQLLLKIGLKTVGIFWLHHWQNNRQRLMLKENINGKWRRSRTSVMRMENVKAGRTQLKYWECVQMAQVREQWKSLLASCQPTC